MIRIDIEKLKLFLLYFLEKSDEKSTDKILLELSPLLSIEQIKEILLFIQKMCDEISLRNKVSKTKIIEGKNTCHISENYYETNDDVDFDYNKYRYINNQEISPKAIKIVKAINEMYKFK